MSNIHSTAGVSEHDTTVFEVMSRIELTKQPPRTIYMYDRANWDALREEQHTLLTTDTTELPGGNVEQLWSKLKVSIAQVVDKHIPHKLTKKRRGLPWVNQNIRKLIRKRDGLYKLCKVSFSEAKYAEFKSLKHRVQKEIRLAHWSCTNNLVALETHIHSNQKNSGLTSGP